MEAQVADAKAADALVVENKCHYSFLQIGLLLATANFMPKFFLS